MRNRKEHILECKHQNEAKAISNSSLIILMSLILFNNCCQVLSHEDLCLKSDSTANLAIFDEKITICDDETLPKLVYSFKITPDNDENIFCLDGDSEQFRITKDKEIKLVEQLGKSEIIFKLLVVRNFDNNMGTSTERRRTINALQITLMVEDCQQVSWQTMAVAVLSSICLLLMSTLAIMLILYQQKCFIRSSQSEEERENEERSRHSANTDNRDESFINPRRTSSYDFNAQSRDSISTVVGIQETEHL